MSYLYLQPVGRKVDSKDAANFLLIIAGFQPYFFILINLKNRFLSFV